MQYPKGGRDGVCRGSGASEKKSRRATTRRPPPHTPTCNIAWIACMGRFVRAQNRLFFRSPIRRLGHICPTQYYIGGSGGVRWPARHVGSFFRSHRNQCSSFEALKHSPSSSWQPSSPQCSRRALPWRLTCRRPSRTLPSRGSPPVRRRPRFSPWSRRSVSRAATS